MALPSAFKLQEAIDEAVDRCGLDPSKLESRHILSLRRSVRLLLDHWSNDGVKQWKVVDATQALTANDGEYDAPAGIVDLLAAFIRRDDIDIELWRIANSVEWHAIPDKTLVGMPSHIWIERVIAPSFHLYPIPDNSTDVLLFAYLKGFEDSTVMASAADVPNRWNEAFTAGLAASFALKFAKDEFERLHLLAGGPGLTGSQFNGSAYSIAKMGDRDRAPTSFGFRRRG